MNNPPDGSNWELLCLYCHDDAHQDTEKGGGRNGPPVYSDHEASSGFRPFEGLANLIKPRDDEAKPE